MLPPQPNKCCHQQEHIFVLKWATQERAVGLSPLSTNVTYNQRQMFTSTTNKCSHQQEHIFIRNVRLRSEPKVCLRYPTNVRSYHNKHRHIPLYFHSPLPFIYLYILNEHLSDGHGISVAHDTYETEERETIQ